MGPAPSQEPQGIAVPIARGRDSPLVPPSPLSPPVSPLASACWSEPSREGAVDMEDKQLLSEPKKLSDEGERLKVLC